MLLEAPLLNDNAQLSATLEACTPGDETSKVEALRALVALREEIDYQIAKGVSDPRLRDPDDVADLQSVARQARSKLQRYLDLLEMRRAPR